MIKKSKSSKQNMEKKSSDKKHKKESVPPSNIDENSKNIYVPDDTKTSPLHNQIVYHLDIGEYHEASNTFGIFITRANALKCVECLIKTESKRRNPWVKQISANKNDHDHWTSGCDYMDIVSRKLNDYEHFELFDEYKPKSSNKKHKKESVPPSNIDENSKNMLPSFDTITSPSPLHNQIVYEFITGKGYGDHNTEGIFSSHANALECVENWIKKENRRNPWIKQISTNENDRWTNECDYIKIVSHNLDENRPLELFDDN